MHKPIGRNPRWLFHGTEMNCIEFQLRQNPRKSGVRAKGFWIQDSIDNETIGHNSVRMLDFLSLCVGLRDTKKGLSTDRGVALAFVSQDIPSRQDNLCHRTADPTPWIWSPEAKKQQDRRNGCLIHVPRTQQQQQQLPPSGID